MFKLFILLCLVNYAYSTSDIYTQTNLSQVKVLVLQEDTVNIYVKDFIEDIDMCEVNNLYFNNYLINNTSNLKIVCKKHFFKYMLCDKDLILLSFTTNLQKCNLVFSTFDNILQLFMQEVINLVNNYIFKETFNNCLRFFGLYFIVKLIIRILVQDNFDFTNNIYTR
jgi:phosphate starvation-inducible membrane PsiE